MLGMRCSSTTLCKGLVGLAELQEFKIARTLSSFIIPDSLPLEIVLPLKIRMLQFWDNTDHFHTNGLSNSAFVFLP